MSAPILTEQQVMRRVQECYLAAVNMLPGSVASEHEVPLKRAFWYAIAGDGRLSPWCGEHTIGNRSSRLDDV